MEYNYRELKKSMNFGKIREIF